MLPFFQRVLVALLQLLYMLYLLSPVTFGLARVLVEVGTARLADRVLVLRRVGQLVGRLLVFLLAAFRRVGRRGGSLSLEVRGGLLVIVRFGGVVRETFGFVVVSAVDVA